MFKVENISKRYANSELSAVTEVSFEVGPGQLLSLLGESGSGKTTLLRLIAGLETPDCGSITSNGVRLVGQGSWVEPEKRNVGLVFQGGALFPHMTVGKNVAYGLKDKAKNEVEAIVAENLELVKLSDKASRYPHEISAGERQRIALIRAIVQKPDIILLDEPYSNLDAGLTIDLRDQVKAILLAKGMTGILVTHDPLDAQHFADKIAILRNGKLLQFGYQKEVSEFPNCSYCSMLINGVREGL